MLFWLKLFIAELLYKVGYLAEFEVIYYPKRCVYFGRTMRQWKREEARRLKFQKNLEKEVRKDAWSRRWRTF